MKKRTLKNITILALGLFVMPQLGFGASTTAAFPRLMRPLGMGGAYVGLSDDENAMFYNPAGLAFSDQKWSFNITPVMLDTTHKTVEFASWFGSNASRLGSDLSKWTSTDLDKFSNANIRLGYNGNVTLLLPPTAFGFPFAAGAYGTMKSNFKLSTIGLIPEVIITSDMDLIVPASLAFQPPIPALNEFFDAVLGGGRLAVGATGKFIQRFSFSERRSALDLGSLGGITDNITNAIKSPKTGIGFDFGMMYDMPGGLSFGFAVQDIVTSIGADTVPMSMDFGVGFHAGDFSFGPLNEFVFALDFDSLNNGDVTLFNKIHAGMETNLFGFLKARGGIYQGYPGFGLAFNLILIRIDYINHATELGRFPGQLEDRQHTFALSIRL